MKHTSEMHSSNSITRKVLIMDDEETIRMLVNKVLSRCGFEVYQAEEGNEAIAMFQDALQEGNPFDLLILDLNVPDGMGGMETYRQLIAENPNIKVVVSSGMGDSSSNAEFDKNGSINYLSKPYNVNELRALVNSIVLN